MPPFHDNEALLNFEVADLAPETFVVEAFSGEEGLSRPFRFEIDLRSEDPDLRLEEIVGKPARFEMLGRKVFGVVAAFTASGHAAHTHGYRAVLVPRLWLLGLRIDTRIFFDQTPADLIKHVLEEAGLSGQDFRMELGASYTEHEFYTQYAESDLDFAARTAEHHGIAFRFEHVDNRDVVVFFDDSREAEPIDGDAALFFNPEVSLASEEPVASAVVERAQLVPGVVRVKDYNYRTPETALLSESELADEPVGFAYEYGAHQKDMPEGDHLARVRNEEIEAGRLLLRIESNRSDLLPGRMFELTGHFLDRLNAKYLVVEVAAKGDHRFFSGTGGGEEPVYHNEAVCIPLGTPYRPPRRTPVPRVPGLHTARIETAGGPYAHLDEEGRYHVKFHYDLSDLTDARASRPIRMSQPYSGPGYGLHFPNHADTEVVVGYVNGDPDRPLALGTAPNPSNQSPVTAANKEKNTIRTWGQNELTLDDTQGRENVFLHATKDHTVDVTNNESVSVGADQSLSVGHDRTKTVGNHQTSTVTGNNTETVQGNETVSITGQQALNVGGSQTVLVTGAQVLAVGSNQALEIGAAHALDVGGNSTRTIGGNEQTTTGGNLGIRVGGDYAAEAAGDLSLTAPTVWIGPASIELNGSTITIVATSEISLTVGGNSITIGTSGITITGAGPVSITGAEVKLNS